MLVLLVEDVDCDHARQGQQNNSNPQEGVVAGDDGSCQRNGFLGDLFHVLISQTEDLRLGSGFIIECGRHNGRYRRRHNSGSFLLEAVGPLADGFDDRLGDGGSLLGDFGLGGGGHSCFVNSEVEVHAHVQGDRLLILTNANSTFSDRFGMFRSNSLCDNFAGAIEGDAQVIRTEFVVVVALVILIRRRTLLILYGQNPLSLDFSTIIISNTLIIIYVRYCD